MNSYALGSQVLVTGEFKTAATGAFIDPTNVFFQYREPTLPLTIVAYQFGIGLEITQVSTGVYAVILNCDTAGRWAYRWYSTGTGKGATEGAFDILSSEFD